VVVPIAKSQAEYLRPLACGDKISVSLSPKPLGRDGYAIDYEVRRLGGLEKLAARVRTEHVCLSARSRERQALPAPLAAWLTHQSA
jgi:1,4-dihydroxy-2-naphthoyl-CoA hydrolase